MKQNQSGENNRPLDLLYFFLDERWKSAFFSKIFWRLFRVFRSFWHSSNCYYGSTVYFCIANALEVLIHFDMLIREHYARNEIKWQHEVICLSLNWVFLAGGIFPLNFLVLHLDKLNVRYGWHVKFFVLQCVRFFLLVYMKKIAIKMCDSLLFLAVSGQRTHSCCTFFPAGCTRGQWMHWVKIACDSDEFCSYSSVLGLFYPAGYSLVLLSCLEERLTAAAAAGAARITKVKDYLHMAFLTRKREVL